MRQRQNEDMKTQRCSSRKVYHKVTENAHSCYWRCYNFRLDRSPKQNNLECYFQANPKMTYSCMKRLAPRYWSWLVTFPMVIHCNLQSKSRLFKSEKISIKQGLDLFKWNKIQIFITDYCPWCNGYRRRKWTRRHEFKSWVRLIAFHIELIPLGKVESNYSPSSYG